MIAIAVGAAVFFAAGLTQLFLLRFEAGDVYPAYSSLRTDPLGTRVLYESLNQMADNSALRNYRPPDQIALTPQTTLLICGLANNGRFLDSKKVRDLMDHVSESGGRLVLTFTSRLRRRHTQQEDEKGTKPGNGPEENEPVEELIDESAEASPDQWLGAASLGVEFKQIQTGEMEDVAYCTDACNGILPVLIPWRTTLFFKLQDNTWQTLYAWQDEPVVAQRQWGRGTVIMSADSYLFSNEALRNHRFSGLLTWLVAPDHKVIFDEFHHGLARSPGIASLARRYRLHGVFGALMVVVALFVWRQAAVFVPPVHDEEEPSLAPAVGRDTDRGLVDLVRQHIPSAELLTICFDAWQPRGAQGMPEHKVAQVRELVQKAAENPKHNDPVLVYREICELLKEGKRI